MVSRTDKLKSTVNSYVVVQNNNMSVPAMSGGTLKSCTVNIAAKSGYTPRFCVFGGTGSYGSMYCMTPARVLSGSGNQSFTIINTESQYHNALTVPFVTIYVRNDISFT